MLKKMRLRMIMSSMLSYLAVIVFIAVLVNVCDYFVTTRKVDQTLSYILSFEQRIPDPVGRPDQQPGMNEAPPPGDFMEMPNIEENYMTRFFVVRFDSNEDVIFASTDYIASENETSAIELARRALDGGSEHGYMDEYRYVVEQNGDTTVVIFLNAGREIQYMKSLGSLSVGVAFVSLILVFILVVLTSKRAIRPIENNIKQQKRFITDASHELKTPLTSISTSIDVLEMEHGEDEWTGNIRSQIGRMTKLVSELVMLSRLDEDMPLPDKESFSLSNAAWEIAEVYEPQAKAQDKDLQTDIEDDIDMTGEKSSIQQLFSVLLDNAIKYSNDKGRIAFSVRKVKGKITIRVSNPCNYDVPPDTDRLFDRFYRPDESRESKTGGSGVGLAIAKAVAEAHGGEISAECPDGKNMTIEVVF
ncbi:Signal transduction histidine kinase [Ruminococcaceae bacterium KH2T8]|nr:Signal transduction histidine kinase [Ruminococcaceae bacterium KH2T8]